MEYSEKHLLCDHLLIWPPTIRAERKKHCLGKRHHTKDTVINQNQFSIGMRKPEGLHELKHLAIFRLRTPANFSSKFWVFSEGSEYKLMVEIGVCENTWTTASANKSGSGPAWVAPPRLEAACIFKRAFGRKHGIRFETNRVYISGMIIGWVSHSFLVGTPRRWPLPTSTQTSSTRRTKVVYSTSKKQLPGPFFSWR